MPTRGRARTIITQQNSARKRAIEDPTRIPEMPVLEHSELRKQFIKRHPEQLLTDQREPHKRFVERLSRDLVVHGVVPVFELSEVRVRAEVITQTQKLAQTTDSLMKIAKEDIPARVTLEDDALSRIYAMIVAFEYVPSTGGALDYLLEMGQRRRETPGVTFIILADS